jgi:hypothetical protein
MRITLILTALSAASALAACGDATYTPRPPVGEKQIECYELEQTFNDDSATVFERADARRSFFDNDCVLRGGSYG